MKIKAIRTFVLTVMLVLSFASAAFAAASVSADNKYFDFMSGSWVLEGNVRVETDSRTIQADKAKVNLITKEVWASGNIYLEEPEQNITFSGGSLYASDESKTAVIKGGVKFTRPDMTVEAETCTFNWKTKIGEFDDLVEVTQNGKKQTYNRFVYDVIKNKVIEAE